MARIKTIRLSLIPTDKTRFILEKLGFINKFGKTIGEYGRIQEFFNDCVERIFKDNESIEEAWLLHLINREHFEAEKHKNKADKLGIERAELITNRKL